MRLPETDDTSALKMIMTRRNTRSVLHWEVPFANEVPRYDVVSQKKKKKKKKKRKEYLYFCRHSVSRSIPLSAQQSLLDAQYCDLRKSGCFCNFKILSGHRGRNVRACSIPTNLRIRSVLVLSLAVPSEIHPFRFLPSHTFIFSDS